MTGKRLSSDWAKFDVARKESRCMQFAKDSFSVALRERLAALNPGRTVTVSGASRPAVVVCENELPNEAEMEMNCFYLEWGGCKPLEAGGQPALYGMECRITYRSCGSVESGVDRGRVLGELDRELLMICQPMFTGKKNFSAAPAVDLGTGVFWSWPRIEAAENPHPSAKSALGWGTRESGVVEHTARVTVFFYPEVEL
jgi:hypothetical protein